MKNQWFSQRSLLSTSVAFYFIIWCSLASSFLMAQSIPAEFNFYTIRDFNQAYFDSNPELKSSPGKGYKDFLRWEYFWKTRVGGTSTVPKGDMRTYSHAMADFQQNMSQNNPSSFISNWHFLGPKNILDSVHQCIKPWGK